MKSLPACRCRCCWTSSLSCHRALRELRRTRGLLQVPEGQRVGTEPRMPFVDLLENDHEFMRIALAEARQGYDEGGVPVGSVLVDNGRLVAQGHNRRGPGKRSDRAWRDGLPPPGRPAAPLSQHDPLYHPQPVHDVHRHDPAVRHPSCGGRGALQLRGPLRPACGARDRRGAVARPRLHRPHGLVHPRERGELWNEDIAEEG